MGLVVSVPSSGVSTGNWNFAKAKRFVARAIGGGTPNDEDLSEAADWINLGIDEMNRRRTWKALQKESADIAVSSGTDSYDLPSDLNHIYAVRMIGSNDRPLHPVETRDMNRAVYGDLDTYSGVPRFYTTFLTGENNQIQVFPVPGADDTLRVYYFRLITELTMDEETLNFPKKWRSAILYKARANMLADHDAETSRLRYWMQEAERAFRQARADDTTRPDRNPRWKSQAEVGVAADVTRPGYWED